MHNKGLYLFAPFVALAAVACGPRNISSPGMIGLDVRVTGGATVNQEIDFTNATLLTLNIQPQTRRWYPRAHLRCRIYDCRQVCLNA